MTVEWNALERLRQERANQEAQRAAKLPRPGGAGRGGPPSDSDLAGRLSIVEAALASVDKTLSVMSEQMRHLATKDDIHAVRLELATRTTKLDADVAALGTKLDADVAALSTKLDTKASATDLATLAGKIDRMALATDLAELKGRVARIPTVPVLTSILVFVSLLFAAATWALRHLPPAWAATLQ